MGKLKPLEVSRLTERGKYPDGGGLYLVVASATSRHWSYRYWFDKKEHWLGLGSLKDVSLAQARLDRDRARLQIKDGIDLVGERKQERAAVAVADVLAEQPTFEECAEAYIEAAAPGWSDKHADQWPATLKAYAYPVIGHLRIAEIKRSHIVQILKPIWVEKRETANRVRGRIETIIAKNLDIDDDGVRNPAELTKLLKEALPRRAKRVVEHHPSLPYADVAAFWSNLQAGTGSAADALRLLILTACRTGEIIFAKPAEFDVAAAVWTIPGERMKMGREHRVPLAAPALAIVKARLTDCGDFLFPGQANPALSNMALLAVLKRMERTDVTAHGFRATFGTWAQECTSYPEDIREAALAHEYKDETIAAYQRGTLLEKRRALMTDWAEFVTRGSNVIQMRA